MNEEISIEDDKHNIKIFFMILIIGILVLGAVIILNAVIKDSSTITTNETVDTNDGTSSPQLTWNGITLDDKTLYNQDGSCSANYHGMQVYLPVCDVKTMTGKNIEQEAVFTTNRTEGTTYLFVYEGKLESASLYLWRNYSHTYTEGSVKNTWVNNYLVYGVINYTNLGTPDNTCQIGNSNNTQMYSVTRSVGGNIITARYCFTSINNVNSTAFRITGNADLYTTEQKTGFKYDYDEISNLVTDVTSNMPNELKKDYTFYKINDVNAGTYNLKWVYSPKGYAKTGKFHIIAYPTSKGIVQSYQDSDYLYQDPSWNSSTTNGLVAYYKLNETSGTNALDSHTNSLNSTYQNSPKLGVTGKIGTAMQTNGVTLNGSIKADINYGIGDNGAYSVSLWFNATSIDTDQYMMVMGDAVNPSRALRVSNSGGLKISVRGANTGTCDNYGTYSISNSVWYHVVFRYDGSKTNVTINGVQAFTCDDTTAISSTPDFKLGQWFGAGTVGFKGVIDEVGVWNRTLTHNEIVELYGGGSGWNYEPETLLRAPTISFVSRFPTDITATNIANATPVFSYNITGATPVDANSVKLFWLTNGTANKNFTWYINGSIITTGFRTDGVRISNISTVWNFTLDDNIYPATYLLNLSLTDSTPHNYFNITTDNHLIKTIVLNMSNLTKYNLLEFDAYNLTATVDTLRIYYCNSTYTSGNIVNPNCALVSDVPASQGANHMENYSKHWLSSLTINTTTGTLGGIKVTSPAYFVWRGRTEGWALGYVNIPSRLSATQTSINTGVGYSDLASSTQDTHIHQFSDDATFNWYVCGNLTSNGIYNCTQTFTDTLNQSALPPSPVIIYSPTATTYSTSVFINYSSSISPVNNSIVKYNITLMNADDTFNQTITANNNLSLNYTWTNNNITTGTFNVHVYATDNTGLYSLGESENFNISATFQSITTVSTSPASPIDYGAESTWNCANDLGLTTEMWVNGVNLTSQKGVAVVRSAGTYTINCSSATVGGYLGSSQTSVYTINKATSAITILASPSTSESYGTETTVTGSDCPAQLTCTLRRNGVVVSNPDVQTLNAGSYTYNYSTLGNTNYTGSSATTTLTINKINPSLVINILPSTTVTNGSATTTTGSGCPDTTCILKRDNVVVTNPETTTLGVGSYVYNYSYAGSTNYNTYSITQLLTVNPVMFAGNNGTINLTEGNISQSLQFQVPYRFVTNAYMNLSGAGATKSISNETTKYAVDYNDTSNVTAPANIYLNFSMKESSRNLSFILFDSPDTTNLVYCYNYTSNSYLQLPFVGTGAKSNFSLILPAQCENNNQYSIMFDVNKFSSSYSALFEVSLNGSYNQVLSDSIPTQLNLSIGNRQIFYNELFNQTNNKTQNFYSQLNTYLGSCTYIGNYCIVPIQFSTNIPSIITYSDVQLSNEGFVEVNQSYNLTTTETASENFRLNIQYDSSSYALSGVLHYNNTAYTATASTSGFNGTLSANVDIPVINNANLNKSFYWTVRLTNTTGIYQYNSTTKQQTVQNFTLSYCQPSVTGYRLLNFTFYDEDSDARITTARFTGTFNYYIGDGDVKKTLSLINTSSSEVGVCLSNQTALTVYTDAIIDYRATNYTERDYYLTGHQLYSVEHIKLYLLNSDTSTSFIIRVQDQYNTPVTGAYVYIQRYYPDTNEYKTEQIVVTDDNGESIGFYQTETVDYRHIIIKNGVTLLTTNKQKIFGKTVPYTLIFTVGTATPVPWDDFEDNPDIDSSLTYNKTSKIVSFTYSGDDIDNATLIVINDYNGNISDRTVCASTSSSDSTTLTCDVTGRNGTFTAVGYIDNEIVERIKFKITTARDTFGTEGLFIAMFIIMVAGFAFIWNPSAGVIAINGALIFTSMMGLITLSPLFIFGSVMISIMALWLLKT